MLVYMNSKTFFDYFLENEEDWVILDSCYILISSRIMTRGEYSIQTANFLLPSAEVLYQTDKKEMKAQYIHQLERDALPYFATIVKGYIKKHFNIIFLSNTQEYKFGYVKYIAEFIEEKFNVPVYDYKKFINKKTRLKEYNPREVIRICDSILERNRLSICDATGMSRKEMIKEIQKYNFCISGNESKNELREILTEIYKSE